MIEHTSIISPTLKNGLRFLGVWPGMKHALVYRLLYMLSIVIMQYFQYLYVFAHCKPGELENFVDSLPPTLDYSLTIIKLITLWTNTRVVNQILATIDTDWRECVNVDQYLQAMTPKASISHFCSNAMVSFYMTTAVLYLLGDYAMSILYHAETDNDTFRPFPIKVWFPFEAEQSPIYELMVVILFVHVISNTYTVATLNSLIFTLVLHASGQIDIICQEFRNIPDKMPCYKSCGYTIGTLIKKHNKIITFSENVDKLFSFMALMQILWNTLVICCLGLVVITSIHNNAGVSLVKSAFAYVAVMMEIFIFCFAGEYLSLKNRSFTNAVYESLWYNLSSIHSKKILFIIMRSQKQMSITAGGIAQLSLETFASIMKTSASYISILYAMY